MSKCIMSISTCVMMILGFVHADEVDFSNEFIEANQKICATKNNNSAEQLIRTIIACQNIGNNSELLPFFYLATDQHDQMMKIKIQEDGTFTVGLSDEPFNFPLIEFRHHLGNIFKAEDQKYILYALQEQRKIMYGNQSPEIHDVDKPRQIELKAVGDFVIESDNAMPELEEEIAIGRINYSGLDISKEPPELLSNEGYLIRINGKYYMFNLPI